MYESAEQLSNEGGDYVVYLDNVTRKFKSSAKFAKSTSKLEVLSAKVQSLNNGKKPMVFFPKAETLEDNLKTKKGFSVAKELLEPIAVLKGAYYDDYSAPGYTLNSSGNLVYNRNITEEFAWENDVYVIGEEELIDCSECIQAVDPVPNPIPINSDLRIDGRTENGGKIQILDLNDVEHWFSGKLELRMIVTGVKSGATVLRDIPFQKTKRKHFKDKKWFDYGTFLFNWNLSVLGDYNIEKWIERDGGPKGTFSITMPSTAYKPATSTTPEINAFPGATLTLNIQKDDDDLGSSLIQFTDNISQEYPLGRANILRQ
ncbi:hypothetical protein [Cellulophaga tyrosinoxydans]|uniref:Uncharacterized protein n=1 Tax=Cellulophaga tyrosinoxydans TaxID=504486 RepID=A0A1W1YH24_9FLAO|nr:hypothetical protein [Cellulophaga tyrosinoxydans]SMC35475.1 hypothetical protein SAMN05660703_0479 [Cellulophaga tyrosinoxydans]